MGFVSTCALPESCHANDSVSMAVLVSLLSGIWASLNPIQGGWMLASGRLWVQGATACHGLSAFG